jgi:hypothetical protein
MARRKMVRFAVVSILLLFNLTQLYLLLLLLFQLLKAQSFNWGMDIFRLSDLSNSRPLTAITYNAFKASRKD